MAIDSRQPVGDLCDLLGIGRFRPGVFDAMLDLLYGEGTQDEAARDMRLANLKRRMTGR